MTSFLVYLTVPFFPLPPTTAPLAIQGHHQTQVLHRLASQSVVSVRLEALRLTGSLRSRKVVLSRNHCHAILSLRPPLRPYGLAPGLRSCKPNNPTVRSRLRSMAHSSLARLRSLGPLALPLSPLDSVVHSRRHCASYRSVMPFAKQQANSPPSLVNLREVARIRRFASPALLA